MPTTRQRWFTGPEPVAAKVPEVGLLFWLIKVITTGMGEAMSDAMGNFFIPLAAVVGIGGFFYALRRQVRATAYHAPTYWACVMMVAVFGTMVADGLHDGTGLSYEVTTVASAAAVGAVFWRWHRAEGTLSIHTITTRSRERYYWLAVLATFALGTAAGDLTAIQLHLGFLDSALLFGGLMLLPALGWATGRVDPIIGFWSAYVITRPLGASIADWIGKPASQTGLGLTDAGISAILLVVFAALVAYVARRRNDIQPHLPAHFPHLEGAGALRGSAAPSSAS